MISNGLSLTVILLLEVESAPFSALENVLDAILNSATNEVVCKEFGSRGYRSSDAAYVSHDALSIFQPFLRSPIEHLSPVYCICMHF